MGIGYRVKDLDSQFHQLAQPPIIVNTLDVTSKDGKKYLNDLLYSQYDGDELNVPPSCDCGETTGDYNVGMECPNCFTEVYPHTEKPLESNVWIRVPEGVDYFINPLVWKLISNHITTKGVNALQWWCSTSYHPFDKDHPIVAHLHDIRAELDIPRGLNAFCENYIAIIRKLSERRIIKKANELLVFLERYSDRIFCKHLPIPSRLCFVTERNGGTIYTNTAMKPAIDAIRTITSINNSPRPPKQSTIENKAATAVRQLAEFYPAVTSKDLAPKEGWFRRHIYGTRSHFAFRGVIASLSEPHEYDECHLPWGLSVTLLKLHLVGKLMRRNYTPNEAYRTVYESVGRYNPLINDLLNELIEEAPYKGIPILLQRNPTLNRGSAQRLFVTKIKTDVEVPSISLSVLVLSAPNADFDGDEMNGSIALDNYTAEKFERLAPHHGVFDLSTPRENSGHTNIPGPVLSTALNWIQ